MEDTIPRGVHLFADCAMSYFTVLMYTSLRVDTLLKIMLDFARQKAYLFLSLICRAKSKKINRTEFELTRQDNEMKWLSTSPNDMNRHV